jgi:hypothetical protein
MGKGSRERHVYFDIPEMVEALDSYLKVRDAYSPLYTHLSEGHVRKVFRLCHPMAATSMTDAEILESLKNALVYLNDQTNQRQRDAISSTGSV